MQWKVTSAILVVYDFMLGQSLLGNSVCACMISTNTTELDTRINMQNNEWIGFGPSQGGLNSEKRMCAVL